MSSYVKRRPKVVVEGRELELGWHTVTQYRDRCRPSLSIKQALESLRSRLRDAEFSEPPEWARGRRQGTLVFVVAGDLALPVVENTLTTCIVKYHVGANVRVVHG